MGSDVGGMILAVESVGTGVMKTVPEPFLASRIPHRVVLESNLIIYVERRRLTA
jgi:hypothetical protein